ncbi:MAG: SCO1664 family protein [Egibacteraceae bacterium]
MIERLAAGELKMRGFLANASNHTLLAQVGPRGWGLHAIYKPRRGERPLWDFPDGTLCQREVAAWLVSEFLGWGIVPPTVLRDGPMGDGSVQLFVPHDPRIHYFTMVEDSCHDRDLARIAVFDLLVNNADRKASHVLLADGARLYGIDHGVCFHVQTKLRTVIWDLGPAEVDTAWREDLCRLAAALADPAHQLTEAIAGLLSPPEVAVLARRAGTLSSLGHLPDLDDHHRPYPWPPL